MVREMTLRCIKDLFNRDGYTVKHKYVEVGSRIHDTVEAYKQGGGHSSAGMPQIADILAVCTFIHFNDNPRNHRCEFFDAKDGQMLSEHVESGDTFVKEVEGMIKRSGLPI